MTYHNPFVILISLVSAVLTILSLKMRRDYREKHRNSWAKLEDGIDTFIKDDYNDGVSLSGGEAQKVAISRAWYKDAPLLILDEPTAALDPLSEFEIYNHFNDLMENRTAVYISHRMSASSFSDRIIVFDKGCVCETGTHQELLRANGVYKTLYETQAQYYK